jgi:flagellar basal-body rod protein FlgC
MGDPIDIAVSGLNAASTRLTAAAGNIANARDTAPLASQSGSTSSQSSGYQPVDVVQATRPGGGTVAQYRPVTPPSQAIFDPGSPFADGNGDVAAPNVDTAQQIVNMNAAQISYEANAKVIEAARKQQGYLLNIFS